MKTKTINLIFCFLILGSAAADAQTGCDPSLWNNVYTPSRLKVLEDCKTVTGIIHDIKPDADGDYHILLQLDPGQESLLAQANIDAQHGCLVIEPICSHPAPRATQIQQAACLHYTNHVRIPAKGDHVRVIGSLVNDTHGNHGWNEIHPVTSITLLSN